MCVDMQRMFDAGTPWATGWMRRVLPHVVQLCEAHPQRAIFTRFIPVESVDQALGAWRRYYEKWQQMTLQNIDPALLDGCPGYCEIGTGDVLSAQGGANLLTISGGGVTALAFDWMTWDTAALSVTLSTGDVIPLAATEFVPGFLGITSTIPITSLTINVPQGLGVLNLDNFAVGRLPTTTTTTSGTVPEPGSLLLILSGLMVLGVSRHRRQAPSPC